MNLENNMLSERSQTKNTISSHLYETLENISLIDNERKQLPKAGVWEEIDWKGQRGTFWSDKNILKLNCCGGLMIIHIWQNSNRIVKMSAFKCMYIIPHQS